MISEDLMNFQIQMAKFSKDKIIDLIKFLAKDSQILNNVSNDSKNSKIKAGEIKLKDLVKSKGNIENIPIAKGELKELKKILNKNGVNFSVVKNKETKDYSVFFQAKDVNVLDNAFKKAVSRFERKEKVKESTIKKIKIFKKEISKNLSNDKVKNLNKSKERSI